MVPQHVPSPAPDKHPKPLLNFQQALETTLELLGRARDRSVPFRLSHEDVEDNSSLVYNLQSLQRALEFPPQDPILGIAEYAGAYNKCASNIVNARDGGPVRREEKALLESPSFYGMPHWKGSPQEGWDEDITLIMEYIGARSLELLSHERLQASLDDPKGNGYLVDIQGLGLQLLSSVYEHDAMYDAYAERCIRDGRAFFQPNHPDVLQFRRGYDDFRQSLNFQPKSYPELDAVEEMLMSIFNTRKAVEDVIGKYL